MSLVFFTNSEILFFAQSLGYFTGDSPTLVISYVFPSSLTEFSLCVVVDWMGLLLLGSLGFYLEPKIKFLWEVKVSRTRNHNSEGESTLSPSLNNLSLSI